MPEEKFLLVSLKETEAKELAQVISNDTSRKILDHLATVKDATESDISKKLGISLSTVHYNVQALMKAKLIHADEFHYSQKGREVNHYSLANKYVIIAPKDASPSLIDKLRKILPAGLVAVAAAGMIQLFQIFSKGASAGQEAAMKGAPMLAERAMDAEVGLLAVESASMPPPVPLEAVSEPNMAVWFLFGAVFAIMVFVVVDWIQSRK